MQLFRALMGVPVESGDWQYAEQRDPSSPQKYAREIAPPPDDAVISGRLWTPARCKTQWADSVFVVYDEVMSSLSGVNPVAFPITADDNPAGALVTPRRVGAQQARQRQACARQEALTGSIATPRGKQWLELAMCERCVEASFAGSFSGLGSRKERPGFTLLGCDGLCYHFAAETFAERAKWVKMLEAALRALCPHANPPLLRFPAAGPRSPSAPSPERLILSSALNTAKQAEAHAQRGLGGPADAHAEQRPDGSEGKTEMNGATPPASDEPGLVDALAEARSEICVERELNRRLERKVRILEKGIVEVRDESEGLRSALLAALDRLSMFSSNSVPSSGIVSARSSNWLQFDTHEKQMDASVLLLLDKVAHLESTLQEGLRVRGHDSAANDLGSAQSYFELRNAHMASAQTKGRSSATTPRFEHGRDGGDKGRGDELARQVAVLQRQVQDLKSELNKAQSDAEAYEKALAAAKSEAQEAQHELQETSGLNKLLQAQVQATQSDSDLQMGALQSTGKELSALKSELLSAYKQIEVFKTELLGSKKAAEAAGAARADIQQAMDAKQRELEKQGRECAALESQLKSANAELLGCRKDLQASHDAFKDKEASRAAVAAKLMDLKKELSANTTELITTQAQLKEACAKLEKLKKGSSESIAQSEAESVQLQVELAKARKQAEVLQRETDDAVQGEKAAKAELARVHETLHRAEQRNAILRDELNELKKEERSSKSDDKDVLKLRRALAEFQKSSQTAAVERETLQNKCQTLRNELDSSVRQLEAAKTSAITAEQKLEYAETQLSQAKAQCQALRHVEEEQAECSKEVLKLRKANSEFQKHAESLQEQVAELNKLLRRQKEEVQDVSDLRIESNSARKKLESVIAEKHSLEAELASAVARASRFQEETKLAQERRQVSEDEIGTLKKQLERAKTARKEAEDALASCEGERSRLKAELSQAAARAPSEKSAKEQKSTAESDFLNRQNERLLQQVATLEAAVVKGEKVLAQTKADLGEEHSHRQDLQHKVVERDRKISALEQENKGLLSDRQEVNAEQQTRHKQLERLLTVEKQAKAQEAQLQKQLDAALLQVKHLQDEVDTREVMLQERDREVQGMRKGHNEARRTQLWTQTAMDEMIDASDESIRTIEALENTMTRLSRELKQLVYDRDTAENEVAALQADVDRAVSKGEWFGAVARALVKNPSPKTSPTSGPSPSDFPLPNAKALRAAAPTSPASKRTSWQAEPSGSCGDSPLNSANGGEDIGARHIEAKDGKESSKDGAKNDHHHHHRRFTFM